MAMTTLLSCADGSRDSDYDETRHRRYNSDDVCDRLPKHRSTAYSFCKLVCLNSFFTI
jgi:hypothetical protein